MRGSNIVDILFENYIIPVFFAIYYFLPPSTNAVLIWIIFLLFVIFSKRAFIATLHPTIVTWMIFLFWVVTIFSAAILGKNGSGIRECVIWSYMLGVGLCCLVTKKYKRIMNAFLVAAFIIVLCWIGIWAHLWQHITLFQFVPDDNNDSLFLLCGIIIKRYMEEYNGKPLIPISCLEMIYACVIILIGSRGITLLMLAYYSFIFLRKMNGKRLSIVILILMGCLLVQGIYGEVFLYDYISNFVIDL